MVRGSSGAGVGMTEFVCNTQGTFLWRETHPPQPPSLKKRRGRKIVHCGGGLPRRLAVIHVSETPTNEPQ